MIKSINISHVLFIDIETVPLKPNFNDLSAETKSLFDNKTKWQQEHEELTQEEIYANKAGILAEFGKIVCISCGIITPHDTFRIKSFCSENEKEILEDFCNMVNLHYNNDKPILCAHNGKEFDFPFIARRLIINRIDLPTCLQLHGKKPWQIPHLDTMELWKFGDFKHFSSVALLAHVLGIPTPKDDINGSQVAEVFYKEKDLNRIKKYCEKDVLTVAQIFRRFRNENLLELEEE